MTSLGIDPILAQHIAHLFVRDTLTLFEEKLNLDNTKDTDHFEVTKSMQFSSKIFVKISFVFRISIQQIGNQ